MSYFQRIRRFISGVFILLYAFLLLLTPSESYSIIAGILSIYLLVYGFKLLIYYISMARHMVGGKSSLFQSIIALDLALFTMSMASMDKVYILLYLIAIFVFSGAIDILRALEQKRLSAPSWKFKLIVGCVSVLIAIVIIVVSIITRSPEILVYGFCISLLYSAVMRIISAFRKTAVIYIQ